MEGTQPMDVNTEEQEEITPLKPTFNFQEYPDLGDKKAQIIHYMNVLFEEKNLPPFNIMLKNDEGYHLHETMGYEPLERLESPPDNIKRCETSPSCDEKFCAHTNKANAQNHKAYSGAPLFKINFGLFEWGMVSYSPYGSGTVGGSYVLYSGIINFDESGMFFSKKNPVVGKAPIKLTGTGYLRVEIHHNNHGMNNNYTRGRENKYLIEVSLVLKSFPLPEERDRMWTYTPEKSDKHWIVSETKALHK